MEAGPETIAELMQLWLETKRPALKQASYATYRHAVEASIVPLIGGVSLKAIQRGTLQSFLDQLYARGISAKSVWDINSKLNAALRWAAEERFIDHAGFCVQTRLQQARAPRVLSSAEKMALRSYLCCSDGERHIKAGILLCLECGLKVGELCALRFEAFRFSSGLLCVDKRLQRMAGINAAGKKTEIREFPIEPRQIPLTRDLIEQIKKLGRMEPTAFFLTGKPDKRVEPRLLQIHFKNYLKACGLDASIGLNALRTTYIGSALGNGENICDVGKIVGAKRLAYIDEKFRPYFLDKTGPGHPNSNASSAPQRNEAAEWRPSMERR